MYRRQPRSRAELWKQEMKMALKNTLIVMYLLIALFTFGYDANQHNQDEVPHAIAGLFAGGLWPLYWSWEAQSILAEHNHGQ